MPVTTSAKKALRQSKRRHARNLVKKEAVKDSRRAYLNALTGERTEAPAKLSALYRAIDKAAKINYLTKGKAARLKSRMAKRLKKSS